MNKKYIVKLTLDERNQLQDLIAKGKSPTRKLTHARILLKADSSENGPNWSDSDISEALEVSLSTIGRVRERFVEEGLDVALNRRVRAYNRSRLLDGKAEAHLVALVCSDPPSGHTRWSLRLLANTLVQREYVEAVSYETVRRTLKKMI